MGRKRRKIIKRRVVKPPPKVFVCPICNEEAVTVQHEADSEYAMVSCARCGASAEIRWYPAYSEVDAYAIFYDIVTGAKKPIEVTATGGESMESAESQSGEGELFDVEGESRSSEGEENASESRED